MELSLQSKTNLKSVYKLRERFIEEEKLHINDKIDYEKFQELYEKYGEDFTEKEFAKYFLDIDNLKHYGIQSGKNKETPILTREYISDEEIENIKEKLIEYCDIKSLKKIHYNEFLEMYEKFSGKLSVNMFAEDILKISYHSVETMRSNNKQRAILFQQNRVDKQVADKIRQEIISKSDLHIGTQIDSEEFRNLYEQYGKDIKEKDFAEIILGMSSSSYKKLSKNISGYASVFSNYIVNPEKIYKLREKVILEENLHIEDSISNDRFKELYKKYAGILSEEMFAEEILDVSAVGVKNMRVSNSNSVILQNIEIPDEYVDELKTKIIEENRLEQNQLMSYNKMKELYKKYGYVLSEKMFINLILEVPVLNYNSLKNGANERISILRNQKTTDFEEIRKRVIEENDLHYDDKMGYVQFKALHQKYAPTTREYVFAEKVLDINHSSYNNIKFDKIKNNTHILLKEKLPSDEEIKQIKINMLKEEKLHIKDTISYKEFYILHRKYGGIIPDYMFAEKMLDLSKQIFSQMKNHHEREFQILLQTKMSRKDVEKLKEKIIFENNLYKSREITFEEFRKIYEGYDHILTDLCFSQEILEVDKQNLEKLKNGKNRVVRVCTKDKEWMKRKNFTDKEVSALKEYLIQGLSEEEIATRMEMGIKKLQTNMKALFKYERISEEEITFERVSRLYSQNLTAFKIAKLTGIPKDKVKEIVEQLKQEEKRKKQAEKEEKKKLKLSVRKKAKKIMNDYIYNSKNIEVVKSYIQECKQDFEDGNFKKENLDLLDDCIVFVQGGKEEIELFSKISISFGEYKKAYNFISHNINNEGVTKEEKIKLRDLQQHIKYAIKKENALNLIMQGQKNVQYIVSHTGVRGSDVIALRKSIKNDNKLYTGNNNVEEGR